MSRLIDRIFKDEERSKTVLATVAAVGGVVAIIISVMASLLK